MTKDIEVARAAHLALAEEMDKADALARDSYHTPQRAETRAAYLAATKRWAEAYHRLENLKEGRK